MTSDKVEKKTPTRKGMYWRYIIYSLIFSAVVVFSTAIFERVVEATEETTKNGSSNPIAAIIGLFGSFLFLQAFVIGIPSVQKWLRKKRNMSRKQFLQLHCDVATTATISIIIHVIFVSLMPAYSDRISWYSIYPWFYSGFSKSWNNEELSFTLASWALFFMIIATIVGYYKNWIYKHYSRRTFIIIQNFTIISLINVTLHEITVGSITKKNIVMYYFVIAIGIILFSLWIIYNIQMINEKKVKKTRRNAVTA